MQDKLDKKMKQDEDIIHFTSHIPSNAHILDIACATGNYSYVFSRYGYRVTGADISRAFLTQAKNKYPELHFQQMNMKNLFYRDNTFDAIWSNNSFHHIKPEEWHTTLSGFSRVLKPEGVLFLKFIKSSTMEDIEDSITECGFTSVKTSLSLSSGFYKGLFKKNEK